MAQETNSLILRYRPRSFAEVRGQRAVTALQRCLAEANPPHCYLLTGPSGVGKTTVARLIAQALQVDEQVEIDAASHSGVNEMRALLEYSNIDSPLKRIFILDECHRLTRHAWDASLKTLEEPAPQLYFALCTTDKVPDNIATRCYPVKLDRLADEEIRKLLVEVIIAENWGDTVDPDVFDLVVNEADGSARRALSLLEVCYDAASVDEAQQLIPLNGGTEPMRRVLEMLVRGTNDWNAMRLLLVQLSNSDFTEGSLIGASRYMIGAINREVSEKKAQQLWSVLAALTYPAHGYDPKSLFYSAIGRAMWGDV